MYIVKIRKQIILFQCYQIHPRLVALLKLICACVRVSNVLVLIDSSSVNVPFRYPPPNPLVPEMTISLKSYIAQIIPTNVARILYPL
jgi:hypothetical protein